MPPFSPGGTVKFAASTAAVSGSVALPGIGQMVYVQNHALGTAYIKFGDSTVSATRNGDISIDANVKGLLLNRGDNAYAAVTFDGTATASGAVLFTTGAGDFI